jgi:type II secretory pathway pseudopilin PulG
MKRRKLIPEPVVTQSSGGGIDLASVMVGIIVIGLIGGVLAATMFSVIPWVQDSTVKEILSTVQQGEQSFQSTSETKSFTDLNTLVKTYKVDAENAQHITFKPTKNDKGDITSYVATAKSASGKVFTVTSGSDEILSSYSPAFEQ